MRKYRSDYSLEEEKKLYEAKQPFRVKCKCGHTCTILNPKGYQLCSWCKHYVFLTPQIEFNYNLKKQRIKEKRIKNER